jgi:putative tricarboxylic transport membrane protein
MINTPGTPSAVVTAFDGYPLTRKGQSGNGLGVSLIASVMGGFIGIIILNPLFGAAREARAQVWPAEYFALRAPRPVDDRLARRRPPGSNRSSPCSSAFS